jgi:ABC-type antimicrobial peptide transport system permease subunit
VVVKTLETYLRETALAPLHIATAIVGACAALALFLGVLGLYGALNDAARARRRDVALRIAMGARRRHVVGQVLREGGRLAGVGSAVGFVASLAAAQVLPRITWGVGAPAWWVWIAGPAVLAVAVAAASLLPARRSLMVDPVRLLREE